MRHAGNSPVSQKSPPQVGRQRHLRPAPLSTQVPPFLHGFSKHASKRAFTFLQLTNKILHISERYKVMYDYNHKVALLCSKRHFENVWHTTCGPQLKKHAKTGFLIVLLICIYLKHAIAEPNPLPFLSDCSVTYQFLVIMAPLNSSFMHH